MRSSHPAHSASFAPPAGQAGKTSGRLPLGQDRQKRATIASPVDSTLTCCAVAERPCYGPPPLPRALRGRRFRRHVVSVVSVSPMFRSIWSPPMKSLFAAVLTAGLLCIASSASAFDLLNFSFGGGYGCGCEAACGHDNGCGYNKGCGCDRGCHRDRCCKDRCHRDRCGGCFGGWFGGHGCGCEKSCGCDMGCGKAAPTCGHAKPPRAAVARRAAAATVAAGAAATATAAARPLPPRLRRLLQRLVLRPRLRLREELRLRRREDLRLRLLIAPQPTSHGPAHTPLPPADARYANNAQPLLGRQGLCCFLVNHSRLGAASFPPFLAAGRLPAAARRPLSLPGPRSERSGRPARA